VLELPVGLYFHRMLCSSMLLLLLLLYGGGGGTPALHRMHLRPCIYSLQ